MKRLGRPSKFTPGTVRKILRLVAHGTPFVHSASAAGVSYQSFLNYRAAHPEFDKALSEALARGVTARLAVIERGLKSADESIRIRSACWWLEHVQSQHFSKTRVELTGENGQPLTPPVIAPVVQFIIPDNHRQPLPLADGGQAEHKAIGAG